MGEAAKKEKKRKVTGERSKKPTMAREWRKLKQREKAEAEARVASPPPPIEPVEPVVPLPPRAKYVKPVFQENELYDSRHNSFLRGDWPHNNKKGIPASSSSDPATTAVATSVVLSRCVGTLSRTRGYG